MSGNEEAAMTGQEPVRVVLLGAGERGQLMFGLFAKKHPRLFKYVAVAEPNDERRSRFERDFGIAKENVFADWQDLLAKPQLADAVINAMPDVHHYPSSIEALRKGYHVLLEKPMAQTPAQCVSLVREAEKQNRILQIFLECRYLELYSGMKRLIDAGDIGRVMAIQTTENPLFHGGSDGVVLIELAKSVRDAHESREVLTSAGDALYAHLLCFAAEEARKRNSIVDMTDFSRRAEEDANSL
jgi:predicted dehydrogenase